MSHSSKQVVSMIYTLEKDFLGFVRRFFSGRVTNFIVYLGLHESFLYFQWKEDQIDTGYGKRICQRVNLFSKIAVKNIDWVSACFWWGHKNNLRLQFRSSFKALTLNPIKCSISNWQQAASVVLLKFAHYLIKEHFDTEVPCLFSKSVFYYQKLDFDISAIGVRSSN